MKTAYQYNEEGNKYIEQQNYQAAKQCYDKAIQRNSSNALYWYNRGNAKYALKDYSGAIAAHPPLNLAAPSNCQIS